ncbi:hypothetical protein HJC23_008568 [Cyclotella cryptica]|uniref:ubiquitinyl hydrolase 1 n=1 Tax=Cyclotella cryptica TaxID=29204 RepID=A0ABD3PP17_9STRA
MRVESNNKLNNYSSSNGNNNTSNDNHTVQSCQDSKRKQSDFEFVDERKIAAKKKQRVVTARQHHDSSQVDVAMGGGGKLFPVRNDRELLEVQTSRGGETSAAAARLDSEDSVVASAAVANRGQYDDDDDGDNSSNESSHDDDDNHAATVQRQTGHSNTNDDNYFTRQGRFKNDQDPARDPHDDYKDEDGKIISLSNKQWASSMARPCALDPSTAHTTTIATAAPPSKSIDNDDDDPATISKNDIDNPSIHQYAHLLRTQHAPPLEITPMAGDGNCLFRAISLQVYGSEDMHALVRSQCLDFMEKEQEHFQDFVAESYQEYIRRKRCGGVHGNHAEIQAMSELYNRKIEVYVPPRVVPMNIFQQDDKEGRENKGTFNNNPPIRLLYMDGNHYDALIDPLVPTAGLGLGLPGLQPGLADRMQLDRAKEESNRIMQENMERKMQFALEESKRVYAEKEEGEMERVLRESCCLSAGGGGVVGGSGAYRTEREEVEDAFQKKALYLSEMEAADFDLEQAVLASSLESYRKAEQERKQPSSSFGRRGESGGRRGRYNSSPNGGLSRNQRSCSSSPVHRTAAATSSVTEPINYSASFSSSPSHYSSSYPYSAAAATAATSAAASSVASFPRARSSSPPNNCNETYYGPSAAASSSASTHMSSDEYPSSVQELVMNGFELSKVLHAYDLIGDNFDDLLSFLLSSTS